ncbi:hypothetical protein NQ317_008192 [Molorchus minor]|uniref:Uncharacterized protein n=1 Tax=Molorchus minor TaxID=1323400 RepID=A0ABQ9J627_9CUCU|nr:hypothetical protein NQ317_008192 [Molorchus minor]
MVMVGVIIRATVTVKMVLHRLFCNYPGPGGSVDSGPASDPNARQGIVAAMFIIFLGIVPLAAIGMFLYYYAPPQPQIWHQETLFGYKSVMNVVCCFNRSKSPCKSRGPSFPSETAKRTEDNHSLLHEDSPPPNGLQNEFFGNFKGFTISPAKKSEPEPVRAAPPPPVIPTTITSKINRTISMNKPSIMANPVKSSNVNRSNTVSTKVGLFNKPLQKYNSFKNSTLSNGIATANAASTAPALPPPNPGSTARPIISPPVLENSTCTAKELISPLKNAPKVPIRAAPVIPESVDKENKRPLSTPDTSNTIFNVKISDDIKKPVKDKEATGGSTLNRIASFLKSSDKKPVINSDLTLKPNQVKASKVLDKDTLRSMKISNPIPQTKIDIAITALPVNTEANRAVVMRAQSMRAAKDVPRPSIHTFGSMRQPSGFKRPLSIPSGVRPKSPPPPRPPLEILDKTKKTVTIKGGADHNQYDDCLNEAAPLEKNNRSYQPEQVPNSLSPEKVTSTSTSNESMGLLGEIVSEIQHRNFDSIYSTSTLARKKKEEQERLSKENSVTSPDSSETYVNTSSLLYPESEYSNMSGNLKSSASSTSSGYIHPSAVNVPIRKEENKVEKMENKPVVKPGLSTFKSDSTKPFSNTSRLSTSSIKSNTAGVKKVDSSPERSKLKTPPSPTNKVTPPSPTSKAASKATVNRQITPPNLRTRKPSPTRSAPAAPKSNRSITNSPDLVISCSANPPAKPPDVLTGGTIAKKPSISSAKPVIGNSAKAPIKINPKSVSFKSPQEKKSDIKPPIAGKVSKANSDVGAALKTSIGLRNAAKQSSTVASLQQKFENKNNTNNSKTHKVKL